MIVIRAAPIFALLCGVFAAEKQIKLEDIEKDNLRADQQAKFEKQYQEYQQYQTYQQQPSIAYQPQQQQHQQPQYTLPFNMQQYLQQALYQQNFQAPVHPFQNYFSQQLQQVPVPASPTQTQPQAVIMAYAGPQLAALQQAYYQNQQIPQYYYQQQPQQPEASQIPSSALQTSPYTMPYHPQQFVPPFQAIRAPTGVQYSENSVAPQAYQPQDFLKPSPQSAASLGQQKQYLQSIGSTVSPLQSKYLNSPQFLAQNYNTIPSTYLLPKATYSGVKPTVSPSIKVATQGGFLPSSPLASGSTNYQNYRSLSG